MAIKKAAKTLLKRDHDFTGGFKKNKDSLKIYKFPDKQTRNKIAGYIARLKKTGNIPKKRNLNQEIQNLKYTK